MTLDKMTTLFFHIISPQVIIHLSMLMMTIIFLILYSPLQIVHIYQRLRYQNSMLLIPWEIICWGQWNAKIVRYVMTMILAVVREKMDDETYSLYDYLDQNSRDEIYIYIYEPTNGAKYLV